MYCLKCGGQSDGRFCPICGHPVNQKSPRRHLRLFRIVLILLLTIVVVSILLALAAKNLNGPFVPSLHENI